MQGRDEAARDKASTAASTPVKVLVLGASFRGESLNHRLAGLAARLATQFGAQVELASMHDFEVPTYDGDVELTEGVPEGALRFSERLAANDALIISSPEYNASLPGGLKNLIDWASRLRPQPFDGKHAFLLSASPSMAGGNRGLWALRVPLEHLGTRVFPDMFSLAAAHKAFANDDLADPALRARLERSLDSFLSIVEAATHYVCLKRAWVEFLGEPPGAGEDRVDPLPR